MGRVDGKPFRLLLARGEAVLGSHPTCPLRLAHPSVSRSHARLRAGDDGVEVEDLCSRNGTFSGSNRVQRLHLKPGEKVRFGAVELLLEEVAAEDLEPGVTLGAVEHEKPAPEDHQTPPAAVFGQDLSTVGAGPLEALVKRLPDLLDRLASRESPVALAQAVGEALFSSLPCQRVEVAAKGRRGVMFHAARGDSAPVPEALIALDAGSLLLAVEFPTPRLAEACRLGVATAAHLISAAAELADPRVVSRPRTRSRAALPDPPTVVAEVCDIYAKAGRVAAGDVGVLILGESGTGKEVLAGYIHAASRMAGGPFLGLNCASLPRDLLEAELFGIEKGVATGVEARPGKFEMASEGTLFLDEIADMAPETQAKILRVLQSREVYRLGGREPRKVRVRTIAATNRDLRALRQAGSFRDDLYHRLAGWVVELPPLRRRRADIPNLAAFFLAREADRLGLTIAGISRAAIEALVAYHWPGNIRQVENEIAQAALFLEDGQLLETSGLSPEITAARPSGPRDLASVLARVEREEMEAALAACGGNAEAAAARLGLSRTTFYRR
ncbi:MAG: sigma 54-interacting transcriptional regulator, partial [Acidobacteriota bacterium]